MIKRILPYDNCKRSIKYYLMSFFSQIWNDQLYLNFPQFSTFQDWWLGRPYPWDWPRAKTTATFSWSRGPVFATNTVRSRGPKTKQLLPIKKCVNQRRLFVMFILLLCRGTVGWRSAANPLKNRESIPSASGNWIAWLSVWAVHWLNWQSPGLWRTRRFSVCCWVPATWTNCTKVSRPCRYALVVLFDWSFTEPVTRFASSSQSSTWARCKTSRKFWRINPPDLPWCPRWRLDDNQCAPLAP